MPTDNWSDNEIIRMVDDYRAEAGSCSLGDIARATGLTKAGAQYRVNRLIADGRLTRTASFGSIRGTDERMMKQMPDGRLIEVKRRRSRSSR